MSEGGMNPDQIERVFGALARIEANTTGISDTLAQHAADDKAIHKALFERIETLQLGQAKQKGFLSALAGVGGILGAGVGYLVERVMRGS